MPLVKREVTIEEARCDCIANVEEENHIHSKPCLEKAFYYSDYSGKYYCVSCALFQTEGYIKGLIKIVPIRY